MKYALIDPNGNIAEVTNREFKVAPPLFWVTAGDDVTPNTHRYENQKFVLRERLEAEGVPASVRVEDLAQALIDKGVLRKEDLPERSRPGPPGRGGGRP